MIAIFWMVLWETAFWGPVLRVFPPEIQAGILWLLAMSGLGVAWYGLYGGLVHRVGWVVVMVWYLASVDRYVRGVDNLAAGFPDPIGLALIAFVWVGLPAVWPLLPLLWAGARLERRIRG